MKDGRIRFVGNPWPEGHRIDELRWTGHLDPETGVWFDLHLKTADYTEGDRPRSDEDEEEDAEDSWHSKGCWSNYHACTISSTAWGDEKGFLVGSEKKKFDLATLTSRTFRVDSPPDAEDETPGFHTYLLDHDSVGDHRISFPRRLGVDEFSLKWRGRIALTYAGDEEFKYRFEADVPRARFEGFVMPEGVGTAAARVLAERFLSDPAAYSPARKSGRVWLRPEARSSRSK